MSRDILHKAQTYGSFHNWMTKLPEEDLQYLSDLCDQASDDTLKDQDSFSQIIALAIFFSGSEELTEAELEEQTQKMAMNFAMELNVRNGKMTRTGFYSLIPEEETAAFSITEKGMKSVEDMMKRDKS